MGQRSQYQIKLKQRTKRKKARDRLVKKGENGAQSYYGKFYIKAG